MEQHDFYKNLKAIDLDLPDVFNEEYFSNVPEDWYVIITDVKNSTEAVNNGKHNDVNLVAASSLIVALNIAKAANIEIPFFFTGDGGTVFVPPNILKEVLKGLKMHNDNSAENLSLELHFGSVTVKSIHDAGHYLKIAKVVAGKNYSKPVIVGDGLKYSEKVIKQNVNDDHDKAQMEQMLLNMEGLECRWDKIKPPSEQNEVVCYLIEAIEPSNQLQVYKKVLQKMDEVYGGIEKRNPLSIDRLKLMLSANKIKKEMIVRFGKWRQHQLVNAFLSTFIGYLYFRFNWKINNLRGKKYLEQVIKNADTLTIDGRINTIMTGSADKRMKFLQYLNEQEEQKLLVYGHFISRESIMTCYIENRDEKHIHFVDGSDGGYTEASKELKQKWKALE